MWFQQNPNLITIDELVLFDKIYNKALNHLSYEPVSLLHGSLNHVLPAIIYPRLENTMSPANLYLFKRAVHKLFFKKSVCKSKNAS